MTFREKLKKFAKSATTSNGESSSAPKKPPPPKEHPLSKQEGIREKSKPYHDILGKFNFGGDERRSSNAGNVSPMGSRRGSLISFRRLSRDGSARDSSEKPRKSSERVTPARKPHSGDPKALEPIQSVAEPHDDEEQEPRIVRDLATGAKATPTEPAIAEGAESGAATPKALGQAEKQLAEPELVSNGPSSAAAVPSAEEGAHTKVASTTADSAGAAMSSM